MSLATFRALTVDPLAIPNDSVISLFGIVSVVVIIIIFFYLKLIIFYSIYHSIGSISFFSKKELHLLKCLFPNQYPLFALSGDGCPVFKIK